MSESDKMYRVKPVFDSSVEIISTISMYKVKKVEHVQIGPGESPDGEDLVPEKVRELEQRQERVMKELGILQQSLKSLTQKYGDLCTPVTTQPESAGVISTFSASQPLSSEVITTSSTSQPLSSEVITTSSTSQPLSTGVITTSSTSQPLSSEFITTSSSQPMSSEVITTSSASQQVPLQKGQLRDVVINADPSKVPLSLLVLLQQLSSQVEVLTSTFVHSSATVTEQKLRSFLQGDNQTAARRNYQLAVTIVWKKIPNGPRLMVSPTLQTFIEGEANVARYLSRLLQPAYDSGDIVTATQIDELLDLSQEQILQGNNKERSAALRTLNARLGKGQWLVGQNLSVADIVAWSAIHEANLVGDAPANVKKWLKVCADTKIFHKAVKYLSS